MSLFTITAVIVIGYVYHSLSAADVTLMMMDDIDRSNKCICVRASAVSSVLVS